MKPHLVLATIVTVAVVHVSLARADQCELVTRDQAETAKSLIDGGGGTFASFCEPCHEKTAKPGVAKSLDIKGEGSGVTLRINGRSVDLAYTYYALPGGKSFRNLAIASGCPATGVSETITSDKLAASK